MTEVEEYYHNHALIENIKTELLNYGYEYNDHKGWYCEFENMLDDEKKRIAKIYIEKITEAIKRNDELKEQFNIPC